jgi:hypothetical protein
MRMKRGLQLPEEEIVIDGKRDEEKVRRTLIDSDVVRRSERCRRPRAGQVWLDLVKVLIRILNDNRRRNVIGVDADARLAGNALTGRVRRLRNTLGRVGRLGRVEVGSRAGGGRVRGELLLVRVLVRVLLLEIGRDGGRGELLLLVMHLLLVGVEVGLPRMRLLKLLLLLHLLVLVLGRKVAGLGRTGGRSGTLALVVIGSSDAFPTSRHDRRCFSALREEGRVRLCFVRRIFCS